LSFYVLTVIIYNILSNFGTENYRKESVKFKIRDPVEYYAREQGGPQAVYGIIEFFENPRFYCMIIL